MKEINLPHVGKYTAETSKQPITQGGNFMWDQMVAYHWFHQDVQSLRATIKGIQSILDAKLTVSDRLTTLIANFDWSHAYSDDRRPREEQAIRDKEFNEFIAILPEDLKFEAYCKFIVDYVNLTPNGGKSPVSFDEFKKGIKV